MRVAHWNLFAPNASGMYETAKDIVNAQRELGLDCALIDANAPGQRHTDGGFETQTYQFADAADVYVMHSHIPQPYLNDGTPVMCCLHGMPTYSWQSECFHQERDNAAPWSQILSYFRRDLIKRYVTFWRGHLPYWEALDHQHRGERVRYAPRPIRIGELPLEGPSRDLAGEPTLTICDQFRLVKDPFRLWFGAYEFWREYPAAVMHQYAVPPPGREQSAITRTLSHPGFAAMTGTIEHIVDYLPEVLRSTDILLTTVDVCSRVVAEAQALGCDVVSAGVEGTYVADIDNPDSIADAIAEAWAAREGCVHERREAIAAEARDRWDPLNTARAMIEVYEELA